MTKGDEDPGCGRRSGSAVCKMNAIEKLINESRKIVIKIGSNVALAHKVYINTGGHEYDKISFDIFCEPVVIEDECWLTNDVYVAPGVTIGKGSIIAARSSVLKSMPGGKICVGTPAIAMKDRI